MVLYMTSLWQARHRKSLLINRLLEANGASSGAPYFIRAVRFVVGARAHFSVALVSIKNGMTIAVIPVQEICERVWLVRHIDLMVLLQNI